MSPARAGAVALALYLVWRTAVSVAVASDDELHTRFWEEGLTDDDAARFARSVSDLPALSGPADGPLQRLLALEEHLPRRCQLFVLHPFEGSAGLGELMAWARSTIVLHPRVVQPLTRLPVPASAYAPPFDGLPVFLLDLRPGASALLPTAWEHVADVEGGTLWRARGRR